MMWKPQFLDNLDPRGPKVCEDRADLWLVENNGLAHLLAGGDCVCYQANAAVYGQCALVCQVSASLCLSSRKSVRFLRLLASKRASLLRAGIAAQFRRGWCYCWFRWSQEISFNPFGPQDRHGKDKLYCRQPLLKRTELFSPLGCTDLGFTDKSCQQGWVLEHDTACLFCFYKSSSSCYPGIQYCYRKHTSPQWLVFSIRACSKLYRHEVV